MQCDSNAIAVSVDMHCSEALPCWTSWQRCQSRTPVRILTYTVMRRCHIPLAAGPPHDLHVSEVRKDSLALLWKPPVYQGRDPVNGFYVDIKEADALEEAWRGVNEKATGKTYMKVRAHAAAAAQGRRGQHVLVGLP